jgi:hypothetical protein
LGITTFAIINVFVLAYSKTLIEASSTDLINAYESYLRMQYANGWANLITLLCSDVVHWVFAMKYWTLACKLELVKNGEDPAKQNALQMTIFVIGLILNIAAAGVQASDALKYSI